MKKISILLLILSLGLVGCGIAETEQKVVDEAQTEEIQIVETQTEEATSEEIVEETLEETVEETLPEETLPEESEESVIEGPEESYIAEDGTIVRMSSERLKQLEEDVMQVIMALPEEKPESTLTQADLDEATVQWFNTTYAVMLYQNNFDYTLIGGSEPGPGINTQLLERDWGITDRASAIENLEWLVSEGHRVTYEMFANEMAKYGFFEMPQEEYLALFEGAAEEDGVDFGIISHYYTNIYTAYEKCGEAGVKAWDYCRVMQMCGNYYAAGYFTLEEAMDVSLAMAKLMQAEYVSWEDMMNSFLCGYDFWRKEDPNEQGTGSYWRHYFYQELSNKQGNPYSTNPWDTEFVVNWR